MERASSIELEQIHGKAEAEEFTRKNKYVQGTD